MSLRHEGPLHDEDPWGLGPVRSRCFRHGERVFAHLRSTTVGLVTYHYIHLYSKNRRCRLAKRKKDQQTGLSPTVLLRDIKTPVAKYLSISLRLQLYSTPIGFFPPSIEERKAFANDSNQPRIAAFRRINCSQVSCGDTGGGRLP